MHIKSFSDNGGFWSLSTFGQKLIFTKQFPSPRSKFWSMWWSIISHYLYWVCLITIFESQALINYADHKHTFWKMLWEKKYPNVWFFKKEFQFGSKWLLFENSQQYFLRCCWNATDSEYIGLTKNEWRKIYETKLYNQRWQIVTVTFND